MKATNEQLQEDRIGLLEDHLDRLLELVELLVDEVHVRSTGLTGDRLIRQANAIVADIRRSYSRTASVASTANCAPDNSRKPPPA